MSCGNFNTIDSRKTARQRKFLRKSSVAPSGTGTSCCALLVELKQKSESPSLPITGTLHSNVGVCRSETIQVVLDCSQGSGIVIGPKCGQGYTITQIMPESVAERCGCIQIGDRLVAINKLYNLDVSTMRQILGDHLASSSYHPPGTYWVELEIEFEMADSVIPSSGVFNVKLAKVSKSGLGITVNGTSHGTFVISEVKHGSPAHRTGSLRAGDILLAVDAQTLQHFNVDALLKDRSKDFTTLTIKRNSLPDFLFDAQQRCNTIYHNIGSTGVLAGKIDYGLYGSSPTTNKFADGKCILEAGPTGLPPHGLKAQSCQPDYYNVDTHDSRQCTPLAVQIRRPFLSKGTEPPCMGRLLSGENTQSLTTETDDYNDMVAYDADFHQQFPRYCTFVHSQAFNIRSPIQMPLSLHSQFASTNGKSFIRVTFEHASIGSECKIRNQWGAAWHHVVRQRGCTETNFD